MDTPTSTNNPKAEQPVSRFGGLLIGGAAIAIALCVYQWVELIKIREGNTTPLCTLSDAIDCAAVWNSPVSNHVHHYTGIPIAGWGLAWGLITFILAGILLGRDRQKKSISLIIQALQLTSASGAAISILLLSYSIAIAVFCPSCLLLYLVVGATTIITMRRSINSGGSWPKAIALCVAVFIPVFALLLIPGIYTPREALADTATTATPAAAPSSDALVSFIKAQPPEVQQILANTLNEYRKAPRIDRPIDPHRITWGSASAPVHLVEWIEMRCPHCRNLYLNLERLQTMAPPEAWNIETRFFPLDSECNNSVKRSDGSGISCLAAKLLICLASKPQEAAVRSAMFQHQRQLTVPRIWEIAELNNVKRDTMQNCVDSQATRQALQEDIDYGLAYHIEGTPLVVINGRKASALPHLIFSLILSGGRDDDPAFDILPPPQTHPRPES